MSKIIENTIDKTITVTIQGETYSVEAFGNLLVSDEVAKSWSKIHGFLKVMDTKEVKAPEVAKDVAKEIEAIMEAPESPEIPEAKEVKEVKVVESKKITKGVKKTK